VISEGRFPKVPTCTDRVPLLGAEDFAYWWDRRDRLAQEKGLPADQVDRLLHRYGSLAGEVLAPAGACPSLGETVPGTGGYLQAEMVYAATHEGARHLDDVLSRRARTGMETDDGGLSSAPVVAQLLAPVLGWDEATQAAELEDYGRQVALVKQAASGAPTDEDAARLADATPSLLPLP
jgi:glycerol-3-phosphate dehydrogenase